MEHDKSQTVTAVRALLQNAKTASLAVLDPDNAGPYVSLVNVACGAGLGPLLLISNLARHTRGLNLDSRASLMLNAELPKTGDALTALRATLSGACAKVDEPEALASYLAHHPHAKSYADFGDFNLWRLTPQTVYVVGGFGQIFTLQWSEVVASV